MYAEFNDLIDFIYGIFKGKSEGIFTSKEFMSAIVGAVVGTVGSGGVTYLMQRSANKQAAKLKNDDRHAMQGALARSLLYKLVRIGSGSFAIYKHLKSGIEAAEKDGANVRPWQRVLKLANIPSPVSITVEEIGIVYDLQDDEVASSLIMADEAYLRLLAMAQLINDLKDELAGIVNILPGKAGTFTINAPKEKRGEFEKVIYELDGVINSTFDNAKNLSITISSVVDKVQPMLRQKFGIQYTYKQISDVEK